MKAVCLGLIFVLLAACSAPYIQHPGSFSIAESRIYDVVDDAHNVIDITRPMLASGALPARFKPAFDRLTDVYNPAFKALKAYHEAVDAGQPADAKLTQLTAANAALKAALDAFKGVK